MRRFIDASPGRWLRGPRCEVFGGSAVVAELVDTDRGWEKGNGSKVSSSMLVRSPSVAIPTVRWGRKFSPLCSGT